MDTVNIKQGIEIGEMNLDSETEYSLGDFEREFNSRDAAYRDATYYKIFADACMSEDGDYPELDFRMIFYRLENDQETAERLVKEAAIKERQKAIQEEANKKLAAKKAREATPEYQEYLRLKEMFKV